jgi:hypothetical protein
VVPEVRGRQNVAKIASASECLDDQRQGHLRWSFSPSILTEIRDLIGLGRIRHLRGGIERFGFGKQDQKGRGASPLAEQIARDIVQRVFFVSVLTGESRAQPESKTTQSKTKAALPVSVLICLPLVRVAVAQFPLRAALRSRHELLFIGRASGLFRVHRTTKTARAIPCERTQRMHVCPVFFDFYFNLRDFIG